MHFRKEWVISSSIGIGSLWLGVGIGYFFGKRRTNFNERLQYLEAKDLELDTKVGDIESEAVELHFEFRERQEKLESLVQQAACVLRELKDDGRDYINEKAKQIQLTMEKHPSNNLDVEDENMVNIFTNDVDDDWDYEVESENRGPNNPYIIHRDEYFANENDYRQSSLTFYKGDNILCDELDVPVYNPEKVVGNLNFGHGSRDPSICYVRNEYLEAEYEILLDHGHFQIEVLGADAEIDLNADDLKHSVHKFRMD